MATATVPSAHYAVLNGLIGQTIRTVTGAPNTVLEVTDSHVLVATERTPRDAPVPVEWVQRGLDLLARDRDVAIHPDVLEHRSAFVGAVLLTSPRGASLDRE